MASGLTRLFRSLGGMMKKVPEAFRNFGTRPKQPPKAVISENVRTSLAALKHKSVASAKSHNDYEKLRNNLRLLTRQGFAYVNTAQQARALCRLHKENVLRMNSRKKEEEEAGGTEGEEEGGGTEEVEEKEEGGIEEEDEPTDEAERLVASDDHHQWSWNGNLLVVAKNATLVSSVKREIKSHGLADILNCEDWATLPKKL